VKMKSVLNSFSQSVVRHFRGVRDRRKLAARNSKTPFSVLRVTS